jgi:hypothetical protein
MDGRQACETRHANETRKNGEKKKLFYLFVRFFQPFVLRLQASITNQTQLVTAVVVGVFTGEKRRTAALAGNSG